MHYVAYIFTRSWADGLIMFKYIYGARGNVVTMVAEMSNAEYLPCMDNLEPAP